jgi:hypothetical protein
MDARIRFNGVPVVWLALCGVLALSVSGCQTEATSGPAVGAVQHPLLEGFPLPPGYQMVPERSVARSSGTVRMAKCEFQGNLSAESTVEFYEQYMPTAQFRLLDRRFESGEYVMRFESASEECAIRVRRGRSSTALVIDLGPRSQPAAGNENSPGQAR